MNPRGTTSFGALLRSLTSTVSSSAPDAALFPPDIARFLRAFDLRRFSCYFCVPDYYRCTKTQSAVYEYVHTQHKCLKRKTRTEIILKYPETSSIRGFVTTRLEVLQ